MMNILNMTLEEICRRVVSDNNQAVIRYKEGQTGYLGALVGEVMIATRGAADPREINSILKTILSV